eukprot:SAG22_NODE_2138_length_2956_cov_3.059153_3_plen_122_part_00
MLVYRFGQSIGYGVVDVGFFILLAGTDWRSVAQLDELYEAADAAGEAFGLREVGGGPGAQFCDRLCFLSLPPNPPVVGEEEEEEEEGEEEGGEGHPDKQSSLDEKHEPQLAKGTVMVNTCS